MRKKSIDHGTIGIVWNAEPGKMYTVLDCNRKTYSREFVTWLLVLLDKTILSTMTRLVLHAWPLKPVPYNIWQDKALIAEFRLGKQFQCWVMWLYRPPSLRRLSKLQTNTDVNCIKLDKHNCRAFIPNLCLDKLDSSCRVFECLLL